MGLEWKAGKDSEVISKVSKGKEVYTYTYNENQNRISKTYGQTSISYEYNSDFLLSSEARDGNIFIYDYDSTNHMTGFTLNGTSYSYKKDDDFNVTAITDNTNKEIARYEYDSQGVVTAILGLNSEGQWGDQSGDSRFVGTLNLIRLHSAYYDAETIPEGWQCDPLCHFGRSNCY